MIQADEYHPRLSTKMNYKQEVIRGMQLLAKQPNVVFVGQGVAVKANCIYEQLEGKCRACDGTGSVSNGNDEMACGHCRGGGKWCVPAHQRLEVPVFENTQLGMCLGMSLAGLLPVCIYPRCNFLILALDGLCNHLDQWSQMTGKPAKVIIKTMTGTTKPLDPGPQHSGEHLVDGLKAMCGHDVMVLDLWSAESIYPGYERALVSSGPTLLIERGNLYG